MVEIPSRAELKGATFTRLAKDFIPVIFLGLLGAVLGGGLYLEGNPDTIRNFMDSGRAQRMKDDLGLTGGVDFRRVGTTNAFIVSMRESATTAGTKDELRRRASQRISQETGCSVEAFERASVVVGERPFYADTYITVVDCSPKS